MTDNVMDRARRYVANSADPRSEADQLLAEVLDYVPKNIMEIIRETMKTTAIVVDRDQIDTVVQDLQNCRADETIRTTLLMTTSDEEVGRGIEERGEIPRPDMIYVGTLYVVGFGEPLDAVLQAAGFQSPPQSPGGNGSS